MKQNQEINQWSIRKVDRCGMSGVGMSILVKIIVKQYQKLGFKILFIEPKYNDMKYAKR